MQVNATSNFKEITTSFPDISHNHSESYTLSSQNDAVHNSTDYEKASIGTTTESTFDQTSLSVNVTGSGTGNVTITEVTDGMQNKSETNELETTGPSITVNENVTTFSTDAISTEVVEGKLHVSQ